MFRRITSICLALCTALLIMSNLSGCLIIPIKKDVGVRYDVSEITSVEVYDFRDQYLYRNDIVEIFEQGAVPVDKLEEDQYAGFVKDLEELTFTDQIIIVLAAVDYDNSLSGYCVKVNYSNGEYDVFSEGPLYYNAGNNEDYKVEGGSFDRKEWNNLVRRYFTLNYFD